MNRCNLPIKCAIVSMLWLLPYLGAADHQPPHNEAKSAPVLDSVSQPFTQLFEEVTVQLSTNKDRYLKDPMAYHEFVTRVLQPRWDASSTTSALLGTERFASLGAVEQQQLVEAVTNTLIRYAFEGLEHYSSQQFHIVNVVINSEATMGWVQVEIESPLIPDIILDVLIKQSANNIWKAVDVRLKGITYVAVKKHQFRETIEERGIRALIADLKHKNHEYFAEICTKTNSSGRAPCMMSTN